MKLRRRIFTLLIAVMAAGPGASGFDFLTSHGTGFAGTVMLSESTASALVSVPTGGINDRQLKLDLGINRKFEVKELDEAFVAAAYRRHALIFSLGLSQFGRGEMYSEKVAKLAVGYQYDSLTVGASLSAMLVEFGSDYYDGLSAATVGLGASYRHQRFFSAITLDNITSPSLEEGSEEIKPKLTLYAEVMGRGSYSVTGRLTVQDREKPQMGVGQKIKLAEVSSVFWGISTEPVTYGGGLELYYRDAIIRYATSYHSSLGFSHTISMAYSFDLKKQEPTRP